MNDYYSRKNLTHLDGTAVFHNAADVEKEVDAARAVEAKWNCKIHSFGALSPIDWYAERLGRLVGVLEIKHRNHAYGTYPTVFLKVRKWIALSLGSIGMGCPALFIVKFTDDLYWIQNSTIDASKVRITGTGKPRDGSASNDVEPIIDVPISAMKALK